jgi:hypothetical protein
MRAVIDGSISLAANLNAHIDAVAVGYVATSAAYVMEGGAAVAAVFEMERERAVERAEAALAVFRSEAAKQTPSLAKSPRAILQNISAGAGSPPARSASRPHAPTFSRPSCRRRPTRASISWSWAATDTRDCRNDSSAASPEPCWKP